MLRRFARWPLFLIGFAAVVLVTVVLVFAVQSRMRHPQLHAWHRLALEEEFRQSSGDASFADYLDREERLFASLRRRVLDDPAAADQQAFGRYNPASAPARLALTTIYNRSYELEPAAPRGAVLMVHGLTDSPYSMRGLAETFFAQGFYVLVLRLPGHGTVPAALKDTTWQDWYAAVVLAARHAAAKAGPGRPFMAAGHSTGSALLTLYAVNALGDPDLPKLRRLYLVSAAIGVSPFAVLTDILAALSFVPIFESSAWLDVLPEYDPYKYNSFPVNAGYQVHVLTNALQEALAAAARQGRLGGLPKITVFQSVVDSTVTAAEVVNGLLGQLPADGHELVVFDVNRKSVLKGLVAPGPLEELEQLRRRSDLRYRLTVISNQSEDTDAVAVFTREAGSAYVDRRDLPLQWLPGVFSVGHVALPFPADDPVYGVSRATGVRPEYDLGAVALRGESGAFIVPLGNFARIRSNPFFSFMQEKIVETLAADASAGPAERGD